MTTNREISFTIRQKIGVLAAYQNGWRKEVNLVEWNGGPAKVDIRDWDPKHEHMGKGVTLKPDEAEKLQWTLYRYLRGNGSGLLKDRDEGAQIVPAAEQDFPDPAEVAEALAEIYQGGSACGQDCAGGQDSAGGQEQNTMFSSTDCMLDVEDASEDKEKEAI